jgi:hypothetical protein
MKTHPTNSASRQVVLAAVVGLVVGGVMVGGVATAGSTTASSTAASAGVVTATFAGIERRDVPRGGAFTQVASKRLPGGSWAVFATVNSHDGQPGAGTGTFVCQLRNGNAYIGGATDRRYVKYGHYAERTLSMNGGAQIPPSGGEVSVWCSTQRLEYVTYGQIMMLKIDGFS